MSNSELNTCLLGNVGAAGLTRSPWATYRRLKAVGSLNFSRDQNPLITYGRGGYCTAAHTEAVSRQHAQALHTVFHAWN